MHQSDGTGPVAQRHQLVSSFLALLISYPLLLLPCRMGRNSVCPSVFPLIRPFVCLKCMEFYPVQFLDASSHLYKRVCPSVGPSVRWSVGLSVRHAFVKNKGNENFWANKCQGRFTRLTRCISPSVCQTITPSVTPWISTWISGIGSREES